MALPSLNLQINNTISGMVDEGSLIYEYKPFFNLKKEIPDNTDLTYLRLNKNDANINTKNPIDIDIETSYDGSANLIINDKVNSPKLVNSRFYLTSSTTYKIGDRKGNLDTNIYTKNNFKIETSLVKTVQSVVTLDFFGIHEGGKMPVGNYTFYFKLADSDGNESDFIAESGKVVCHIGNKNQPRFIRGGQENEDSGKSVKFRLNNLDLAYSYIHVYYTKSTNDSASSLVTAYKINDKFKINKLNTDITITGYEDHVGIDISDINVRYSEFSSVKTIENCQNMTFVGNIAKNYELYTELEKASLYITPDLAVGENIGNLDHNYEERVNFANGYEYYNVNNIYYRLGYWEDIYRIGVVYIMNDYTLSPVFNIRGIKELTPNPNFKIQPFSKPLNFQEDYIIEGTDGLENCKGVFKISSDQDIFNGSGGIKPLGLKFKFQDQVLEYLKGVTKGFFIVRQQRIPTIIAQSVGIGTTKHGNLPTFNADLNKYIIESFLSPGDKGKPALGSSTVVLEGNDIRRNAFLCPEATLRSDTYNTYFNSSEYTIQKSSFQGNFKFTKAVGKDNHYFLTDLTKPNSPLVPIPISTNLLLIEPNIELIKNNNSTFSSKAGDAVIPYSVVDVKYGDYANPLNTSINNMDNYNLSTSKVRGVFNSYIGADINNIESGTYYNIYQKDYDFEKYWKEYFKLRYNDSSAYYAISDRKTYNTLVNSETDIFYRGDCYINTFSQRMQWNFIDPELPTNKRIVDRYNWYKNYRVINKITKTILKNDSELEELSYKKLLPLFTFKERTILSTLFGDEQNEGEASDKSIIDPEDRGFKKYSEINGTFGYDKLNRPDINAVGVGNWVTFKVFSNINLAMRDVDFNNPQEETIHGMKRSFYPLQSIEKNISLPESKVINRGISKTTSDRYYFDIPDVPFIKSSFTTRINYSNILQESTFVNGNRVFLAKNYQDYTLQHGQLVKLVEWFGTLIAIMEHGILQIPVNERSLVANESGENIYINTDNVLPKNPKVISNTFGSTWANSIIKTPQFIYGIDTVGKKIWRTNGEIFELISDLKIQKFLNDNVKLRESDRLETVGLYFVKSHYNAFKSDVLFTFKYGNIKWHLCWNELLSKWTTRYSWFPEFSENINNIFYTFANDKIHTNAGNYLYKHGFAGNLEEQGAINPANWYTEQQPFEFEFVVADTPSIQKIFDNLKIISNKVEPNSFIFEIVGDSYEWNEQKQKIIDLNYVDPGVNPDDETTGFGYGFDLKF